MVTEVHDEVLKSIVAMPNFGASHELFGVLEMDQDGDHQLGEQHLQLAVQLEPENLYFQLTLAQAQIADKEPDAARKTLATLLLPGVEAKAAPTGRGIDGKNRRIIFPGALDLFFNDPMLLCAP